MLYVWYCRIEPAELKQWHREAPSLHTHHHQPDSATASVQNYHTCQICVRPSQWITTARQETRLFLCKRQLHLLTPLTRHDKQVLWLRVPMTTLRACGICVCSFVMTEGENSRCTKRLTHLPLDKMAVISQTIFSYAFPWMKNFIFYLKFHWSLFLRVHLTITQHWFR